MLEIFQDIDNMDVDYELNEDDSIGFLLSYDIYKLIGYGHSGEQVFFYKNYVPVFKELNYNQQKELISYLEKKFLQTITSATVYGVKGVIYYSTDN